MIDGGKKQPKPRPVEKARRYVRLQCHGRTLNWQKKIIKKKAKRLNSRNKTVKNKPRLYCNGEGRWVRQKKGRQQIPY